MSSSFNSIDQSANRGNSAEPKSSNSYPCPFPHCRHSYQSSGKLKQHLRNLKGGGYDQVHPAEHAEWQRLDESGYLMIHTRPGDLTAEEKERRRAATQRQFYEKHRDNILQKSRDKRIKIQDTLKVAQDLGNYAQSAQAQTEKIRNSVEQRSRMLQAAFGSADRYTIDKFINLNEAVSINTFPRFVVYYLEQDSLPPIHQGIINETRILEVIPGERHFRLVSSKLHPDRRPGEDSGLQTLLSAGFDLWRPILSNAAIQDVLIFGHDESEVAAFNSQGPIYTALSQMYFCYLLAVNNAFELLSPKNISLAVLNKTLAGMEEEELLLRQIESIGGASEHVESLIQVALNATSVMPKREQRASKQIMTTSEEDDSEEDDVENMSGQHTLLPSSVDPNLTRRLRPRKEHV
jgi:hypothetical protein